ncbi:hypothetical protein Hanom_Chr14g01253611 [Helianthus anomalus]
MVASIQGLIELLTTEMQRDTTRSSCRCFLFQYDPLIFGRKRPRVEPLQRTRADQGLVCFHWLLNVIPIL